MVVLMVASRIAVTTASRGGVIDESLNVERWFYGSVSATLGVKDYKKNGF